MIENRTGQAGRPEPDRHGSGDLQPERADFDSEPGQADFEYFEKKLPVRLNAQQREAARTVDGPVLLLAVPGGGKTTVLVARLGYMVLGRGIAPENILTVTYTVAATRDMRRRFSSFFGHELADRMEFRTINGICAKIIAHYSRMAGRRPFRLVTQEKQTAGVLSKIYEEVEGDWPTEGELGDVRAQITYIKNMMLTKEEIENLGTAGRGVNPAWSLPGLDGSSPGSAFGNDRGKPGSGRALFGSGADLTESAAGCALGQGENGGCSIGEIYTRYNKWLRDNCLMDYDDQMVYACTMLRRSPQLLAYFQDQYRYLCVDEAQDTSKIQHVILALLASKNHNLFMVGDEDQSIYGFRAAWPEALTGFEQNHPGAKILLMEENFRSTGSIVAAADSFIQRNTLRHEKSMRTSRESGPSVREIALKGRRAQYTYLAKVAADCRPSTQTPSGPESKYPENGPDGSCPENEPGGRYPENVPDGRYPEKGSNSRSPENGSDGKFLEKAPAERAYTTAVLYRNNESAVALADLLDREGIPFRIRNAEISFFTHRTVADIRSVLRLCLDPSDREAFLRIYYKFGFYLKKEQAEKICEYSKKHGIGVFDAAIGDGIGITDPKSRTGKDGRAGNPLGLHTKALRGLKSFRTHLRSMKSERGDEAVERIVKYMGYGDYLGGSGMKDGKIFLLRTLGARTAFPAELLQRLDELQALFAEKEQDPDCPFVLSTIHASKGLEYDTVYLMDVMDGIFPENAPDSVSSLTPQERAVFEEERRIFYVGLTRAKNRLNVFTTPEGSLFADELFGRSGRKTEHEIESAYTRGSEYSARTGREKGTEQAARAGRAKGTDYAAGSGHTKSTEHEAGSEYVRNRGEDLTAFLRDLAGGERPNQGPDRKRSGSRGVVREAPAYSALSKKSEVSGEELKAFTDQLGEGLVVTHRKYGEGAVAWVTPDKVSIAFEEGEKTFSIRALCANRLLKF